VSNWPLSHGAKKARAILWVIFDNTVLSRLSQHSMLSSWKGHCWPDRLHPTLTGHSSVRSK
jgi:hypothetical protein